MKSILTPHGHSVETGPLGEITITNLYTCAHCQKTWEAPTRSMGGKLAGGFCGKCVGYLCKNPDCLAECIPWEQRVENIEAGRFVLTSKSPMVVVPPDLELVLDKQAK